ncbi:unnamed protein product [Didymodactylos carnosus]|uniref:WxxW domain-containing protein n=1 Tax=Didymodactylos carnosus TaxID=1234261 RepID=A0A8S2FM66_9BILA|nr:unnamed protein product [Didymodactylos carnosus]CAF4298432.1 unnamed protein product [Didymodactylos carnosus]
MSALIKMSVKKTNTLKVYICRFLTFKTDSKITGTCTQPAYEWKIWLNSNKPYSGGEFELVPHYYEIFRGQPFVCQNPTGLEVKTSDDREPEQTNDTFRFTLTEGFLCLNQIIPDKRNVLCQDYKIKFCCPT